ncbi:uncharacterized protein LOC123307875 [Coccinella septempunctata]|uniref:uncharacterized protein LOC123307875 n=1 Tax=Coccinella septempunctata TaxID=41139 RepID=UPI001D08A1D3|nr:uncharacterized protein LOC123307875 [Coccinella septempunctata]
MNTSVSKDLSRNTRKKYNIRSKNRHGYFHNTHNFNVINRNSSFQPNSVGFSEYVLHNQNRRPYTRYSTTRANAGYLKHISSQSIRKEKEHSTIGCYEEYTLKKIRATSDMIKQQLMSPEHSIIVSENETNDKSDNVTSKLKERQSRSVGGTSSISDNKKDNSSGKSLKKQNRLSEEVSRLQQLKERRKNELREKFKKDKIASQKSADIYNVKEISDKILQHISKMNNDRLVDFVNSDNSRYEEAFNYICKQKTFELTKALRDLSHQEKPEECEFVNSIIPEFSIKIEELPISVIRELSSTFDELHKDIVNPLLSGNNLRLFNESGEFQRSNDFSLCKKQTCGDNMNYGNNLNICSNEYQKSGAPIDNAIGNTNFQFIEIIDSDEENLPVKLEKENLPGQQETDTNRIEQASLKPMDNIMPLLPEKYSNLNTGSNDTILCQEKNVATIYSNFSTQNFQSSSRDAKVSVDKASLPIEANSVGETNILNSHSQDSYQTTEKEAADSTFQEVEEKPYIELELGEPSIQEKIEEKPPIQLEIKEESSVQSKLEETPPNQVKMNDLNSQPKVGSVWVSKSIFATSGSLEQKEHSNVDETTNSHCQNSDNLIPLGNSNNITLLNEQISRTPVENVINSNGEENIALAQRQNEDISNTCNSEPTVLPSIAPKDNLSLDAASSVHDKLLYVKEVNDKQTQKVANRGETMINMERSPENETCLTAPPTTDRQHELVPSPTNNSTIPSVVDVSPENEFISLTIKPFEKPKNLVDAVKMMKLIDEKIEVLTKLRQNIFVGLSESVVPSEEMNPGSKKRKLDDSEVVSKRGEISEKRKTPIEENPPEEIEPFSSLNTRNEVILFCRIMKEKDECIVGTDNGKIQYHSIYGKKPLMVVTIGRSAISFLEIVRIYDRNYICTGTHTEYEIKILMYKRQIIEKRIRLEDSIQALAHNWGYFFIGGRRGYLTRYDYKKNRIQFEDRISSSRIKDLKTTKEGPRKLLLIFFEDDDGVAHIHVRDAMTALHIRTIIDMKNVRCMYLRHSYVYLATDGHIHIYNGTNGDFVRSLLTNKEFFSMRSRGNLLILAAVDGIYAFNMRNNHYLGCFQEENAVSSVFFHDQKIVLTTWENKIAVLDIPDHFKAVI